MAKRKLYHIQTRPRATLHTVQNREVIDATEDMEFNALWHSPIEGQFVGREYARGYIACSQSYYPSPDIRIIKAETEEVVEERKGNGEVNVS
tara:strand:+ start:2040 stop:2315 length:276 start_codon:yes stop_codon:yes gene_type:complete